MSNYVENLEIRMHLTRGLSVRLCAESYCAHCGWLMYRMPPPALDSDLPVSQCVECGSLDAHVAVDAYYTGTLFTP